MKKILRILLTIALLLLVVAGLGILWLDQVRPGLDAYQAHRYPDAAPASGSALTAAWFGTTAILLSDDTSAIFIDPFFTRPGGWLQLLRNGEIAPDEALIRQWLKQAGIEKLDAVLVTHSHYDHGMDAGVVARLTGALLLGSASTANIGRGSGLQENQVQAVRPGEPMHIGSFTLTFLESRHAGATGGKPTGEITQPLTPPAHYLDYKQGGTFSILVEHPLGTVLHHGSAGWMPDMFKGRHADVVFLGIAAAPATEAYFSQVVDAVGARRIIPTHWDDFTRPLDQPLLPLPFGVDLDGFFADATQLQPQLKVLTLEPGRRVILFPQPVAAALPGSAGDSSVR